MIAAGVILNARQVVLTILPDPPNRRPVSRPAGPGPR
jgi:hypothetical protein